MVCFPLPGVFPPPLCFSLINAPFALFCGLAFALFCAHLRPPAFAMAAVWELQKMGNFISSIISLVRGALPSSSSMLHCI